jgi:hypothetical protein
MHIVNQIRGYAYVYGVLRHQQEDPFCGSCSAFANSLHKVRESLGAFDHERSRDIENAAEELRRRYAEAKSGLMALQPPDNPSGQKKAGNCKLPQGVCFVKWSLAIMEKMSTE